MKNSKVKYLVLASILASTTLGGLAPLSASAAEVNPEVAQMLAETKALTSGVVYTDANGEHELPIPEGTDIKLNATNAAIVVNVNGKKHTLNNVQEVTFKNISVSNLVPFYVDSVKKVTLDGVNFKKGVDFSGMKEVETLLVKNSTFGSTDYSLAIHVAPKLTTFAVDNSTFNADLRIYSNHALETATISNSVLIDDAKQYSNKKGYATKYVNNRFERSKHQKVINSGGMNANDIFYINPSDAAIATSGFDASQAGMIIYKDADSSMKRIDVPAGVSVTKVHDTKDSIAINLSNGQNYVLNGAKELTFRNTDIAAVVAFTQKGLRLEKLAFVDSKTRLVDVAYSETMKAVEFHRSEVSQSSGYISVYNNKALEDFIMQDSSAKGSSGYISVYNNTTLNKFVMNDDYSYGYLSAYNLGNAVLQISNSQFDDYISTNQVIEGEAGRQQVGYVPELHGLENKTISKGDYYDVLADVTATDIEDGDLTANITVEGYVDEYFNGEHELIYTVTDSDGNVTEQRIVVTVVEN